jgi:ABC-type transporter Mla subunit MlaD
VTAIDRLVDVSDSLASSTGNIEELLRNTNLTSDEAVALLREDRAAVHEFLKKFAVVNEIQADHGDDLKRLLRQLPKALAGVNKSFEPSTGLIRFGLVTEPENPACSYGSNRRPPEDRSNRLPPKKLRCQNTGQQQRAVADTSGTPTNIDGSALFMPGVSALGDAGLALPARMSSWSWTLFYLNGV